MRWVGISPGNLLTSNDGLQSWNSIDSAAEPPHRLPGVATSLHVEPEFRTVAAQLAETDRHLRANCRLTGHNAMKCLSAYAEESCYFADGAPTKSWQNVLSEKHARMSRDAGDMLAINGKLTSHNNT